MSTCKYGKYSHVINIRGKLSHIYFFPISGRVSPDGLQVYWLERTEITAARQSVAGHNKTKLTRKYKGLRQNKFTELARRFAPDLAATIE
jgi:hypothetical protein